MKTMFKAMIVIGLGLPACAGSPPPEPTSGSTSEAPSASQDTAQQPDLAKARAHLEQHVEYPADRAKILAACAQTPEFTEAEKRWFEKNLPEGNYQSAADAIAALKL